MTIISRRKTYNPRTKQKRSLKRRISNEAALLAALQQAAPAAEVRLLDLANLSLLEQLRLVSETDILVGEPLGSSVMETAGYCIGSQKGFWLPEQCA